MTPFRSLGLFLVVATALHPMVAAGPSFVDITWLSMANLYYEIGDVGVVTDGYITRIPQDVFSGGPSGLARTRQAYLPDREGVARVLATRVETGSKVWRHFRRARRARRCTQ